MVLRNILKLHLIVICLTANLCAEATMFVEVLKTDPIYNVYEQQINQLKYDIQEKGEFDYSVSVFKNDKLYPAPS